MFDCSTLEYSISNPLTLFLKVLYTQAFFLLSWLLRMVSLLLWFVATHFFLFWWVLISNVEPNTSNSRNTMHSSQLRLCNPRLLIESEISKNYTIYPQHYLLSCWPALVTSPHLTLFFLYYLSLVSLWYPLAVATSVVSLLHFLLVFSVLPCFVILLVDSLFHFKHFQSEMAADLCLKILQYKKLPSVPRTQTRAFIIFSWMMIYVENFVLVQKYQ